MMNKTEVDNVLICVQVELNTLLARQRKGREKEQAMSRKETTPPSANYSYLFPFLFSSQRHYCVNFPCLFYYCKSAPAELTVGDCLKWQSIKEYPFYYGFQAGYGVFLYRPNILRFLTKLFVNNIFLEYP